MDSKLFWPLQAECANALNLARSGLKLYEDFKHPRIHSAGVFSCLALASEKLFKLTLGIHKLNTEETWPIVKEMRSFGHSVVALDAAARAALTDSLSNATHRFVVAGWEQRVDSVPWLPDLLAILSDYGSGGRFHELNLLAGSGQGRESPADAWLELESKITTLHPEILNLPISEWGSAVNGKTDLAFRDWWTLYSRSWVQGVFGPDAKRMSSELEIGVHGKSFSMHK